MRKQNQWAVKIQSEDGQVGDVTVKANWDPDHPLTEQSVADAATLPVWFASRSDRYPKGMTVVPISIEQVPAAA